MRNNIVYVILVAVVAASLAWDGASLEMSLLTGFAAGCFFMLWDINLTLRKTK